MTIATTTAILLSVILAILVGRAYIVNAHLEKRLTRQTRIADDLQHCLNKISSSYSFDREFSIEEDHAAYHVIMTVTIHKWEGIDEKIIDYCDCRIKSFPYADDMAFAFLEAQELLESLQQK